MEWQTLYARRENYPKVPPQALVLMGGIDTQDDRYEGRVWAFGLGEEAWLVHRFILTGDPASEELRRKVGLEIHRQFTRAARRSNACRALVLGCRRPLCR